MRAMNRVPKNFITKEQYHEDRELAVQPDNLQPGSDLRLRRTFTLGETLAAIGAKVPPIFCVEEMVSIKGIEKVRGKYTVQFHYLAEGGVAMGRSRRMVNENGIIISRWSSEERGYFLAQEADLS